MHRMVGSPSSPARWPRETHSPRRPPLLFVPLAHPPAPRSARRRPPCLVHVGVATMVPSPVITNSWNLRLPVRQVEAIRLNQSCCGGERGLRGGPQGSGSGSPASGCRPAAEGSPSGHTAIGPAGQARSRGGAHHE